MAPPEGSPPILIRAPWYAEGLRFECQPDCGACCRGPGGHVWVTHPEMLALGEALGLTPAELKARYVIRVRRRWSLRDQEGTGDCIFLRTKDGVCSVYEARPVQCRTYPFWRENVVSRRAWTETARECPGCNVGRLHSQAEVEQAVIRARAHGSR